MLRSMSYALNPAESGVLLLQDLISSGTCKGHAANSVPKSEELPTGAAVQEQQAHLLHPAVQAGLRAVGVAALQHSKLGLELTHGGLPSHASTHLRSFQHAGVQEDTALTCASMVSPAHQTLSVSVEDVKRVPGSLLIWRHEHAPLTCHVRRHCIARHGAPWVVGRCLQQQHGRLQT